MKKDNARGIVQKQMREGIDDFRAYGRRIFGFRPKSSRSPMSKTLANSVWRSSRLDRRERKNATVKPKRYGRW